jgi:glycosyltransferase involved in cell wall biosynthesis
MLYVRAIRKVPGISATAIPLYLPPQKDGTASEFDPNVFFGAISMYVRGKIPFLRRMPDFMDKLLDTGPMLKFAAHKAGTTRTEGMEDLTLNMITGENAFREKEVDRLISYLKKTGKPDIIHLSNALIVGLAHHLKKKMDVRIVCSLLNEDDWIDDMSEPYRSLAWKMIAKEAVHVDAFITPSNYYKNHFIRLTGVEGDNIHIVPLGIETPAETPREENIHAPSIGYFCRVNEMNGFDKIVDAFIRLKSDNSIPGLTLHVCGGYTADDRPYVRKQVRKITRHGYKDSVRICQEFEGDMKREFFKSIDLMSVPVRKHDGYGLYILEANSEGVPVVQPDTGAFAEIVKMTGGGVIYSPDTTEELALIISKMLKDKDLLVKLGEAGRKGVREKLTLSEMSSGLEKVYKSLIR